MMLTVRAVDGKMETSCSLSRAPTVADSLVGFLGYKADIQNADCGTDTGYWTACSGSDHLNHAAEWPYMLRNLVDPPVLTIWIATLGQCSCDEHATLGRLNNSVSSRIGHRCK